jgi:homoserine O-acetyltransferase/O-succinyltransferase
MAQPPTQLLRLGDIRLQSGETLADAQLAYVTLGTLNAQRDNAIVLPTYYTGQHTNYLKMIGPQRALDPSRYFVIIPNMFGNGLSTSPSNDPHARVGQPYPTISVYDNVAQQARLVFEHLAVSELALVCGWSMGGMQAYQWAALHPLRVRRMLACCSAARTSPYNQVFLDGLRTTLQADRNWREGRCSERPEKGLRAFGRVYAGWAYSHAFFRDALYRTLGYPTQDALLEAWEADHLALDANDLMAMLVTWQHADVSANEIYQGDFARALGSIRARTVLLPSSTDRYFPPEDNALEAQLIPDCELRVLESDYGHCALSPGRVPAAMAYLDEVLRELLSR